MKPMKIGIGHMDLDGAASKIILDAAFKFDRTFEGAYHRIDSFINAVPQSSFVIVYDLSLTTEQYMALKDKSNLLMVVDHHPDTVEIENIANKGSVFFSEKKSASALSYELVAPLVKNKDLLKRLKVLAILANEYDLYKEGSELFERGYDLNLLFWDYKFDKFVDEFKHGLLSFSPSQSKRIKELRDNINLRLSKAEYHDFEYNEPTPLKVLICIPEHNSLSNDVPRFKPGFDVYFIVNHYKDHTALSVRSKGPLVNLSCELSSKKFPKSVANGGGHPLASGVNLLKDPQDSILDIINFICEDIISRNIGYFKK